MPSLIQCHEGINSVAVIGNYSPRLCGIATVGVRELIYCMHTLA